MIALNLRGQTLSLPLEAAIETNNRLSARYKAETDAEKRREIIDILYQINIPLFKKWQIFNYDEKEDYSQEAYFFIARALEKYDPSRGAFLFTLKQYYVKESQRQYLKGQAKQTNIREAVSAQGERVTEEDASDSLFWQEARQLIGEEAWEIVGPCLFDGLTPTDVARALHRPQRTINYKYNRALEDLKIHLARKSIRSARIPETIGEGEWLGSKKFCRILDITPRYLKDWLNPNRPISVCPTYLDPRDVAHVQGIRVRYLFTPRDGLVFPRSIPKKRV